MLQKDSIIHIISFYTEGSPYDNGKKLVNEKLVFEKALGKHFPSIKFFCPRKLIEQNLAWEEILTDRREWIKARANKNPKKFTWVESWAALNFLLWKPHLISHVLHNERNIDEGDIILYHDVDVSTYPEYLQGIHKWKGFIKKNMRKKDVLLFTDNKMEMRQDVKLELLKHYHLDDEYCASLPHVWVGCFAIKKNDTGRDFIEKWLTMCSELDNLSPETDFQDNPGFIHHSPEQSCMSVLYHSDFGENNSVCLKYLHNARHIPTPPIIRVKSIVKGIAKELYKILKQLLLIKK